jgi:hypothetical protein
MEKEPPNDLITNKDRSSFESPETGDLEALAKKYGEKLVFLTEEDKKISLEELMAKYDVSRSTAWRMLGRGYVIKGAHDRNYLPDPQWAEQNAQRLSELARRAYRAVARVNPDIFPPLESTRTVGEGISPEDLVQEAMMEIVGRSGSKTFLEPSEKGGVKRDHDGYLMTVMKHRILNSSPLRSAGKLRFEKSREPYYDSRDEYFADKDSEK